MDEKSLRILEFDKILLQLAEHTSFSAGRELALALRPTADEAEADRWQAETREGVALLESSSDVTIGGARDVRRAADSAMRGVTLQPDAFLDVRNTLIAARTLRRQLLKARGQYPHLAAVAELIEECPGLVSAIGETLDEERGDVLDSASDRLAKIRRSLRVAHDRIQDKLQSLISSSMSKFLQEPIITSRGGRYVVPLKAEYKGRIKGIVHDQSSSGATLWIEPMNTVELNNEYRSLQSQEEEEIQRVLAALSVRVAEWGDAIKRVVERVAELDLILARAQYALATEAVEPTFVSWRKKRPRGRKHANEARDGDQPERDYHPGSTVWIRGARHPLLDPHNVVPIDLLLHEDIFLVLITGPNTGGKTVSLKTMGLMAIMAQAGLHVPANEARLTVFENVFADIGDEQSIEQSLSTFSSHITNITRILEQVDERSLVLLDELGSGTDPAEGAALAQAIVNFLRDKGATTFVATHYPELKVYASQTPGATNASLLFDIDTLSPTYEMTIGLPGRSNAVAIARRLGLDETILDDAMEMLGAGSERASSLLDSIYDMRERISSQEAATRLALRQVEEERDELRRRLETIETERQEVLAEARQEAQEQIDEVRQELTRVRRELRALQREAQEAGGPSRSALKRLGRQVDEVMVDLEEQPPAEPQPSPRKVRRMRETLEVGDVVRVKSLNTKGEILSLDKKEAEVAVGRLHTRASLADLELLEPREEKEEEPQATVSVNVSHSPGMELDLRGQRVEEGLASLDSYLDSAFLAELPYVRIIHGKGTGRLREAVRQALSRHTRVRSWEEGKDGEGGAGVTVVKLTGD
ncbi:MAG TPA: Smr/MutS family protein [Candidatus Sulfomarinibacteraceae bacterium]|nr:Smr/MutS family protein [Candidatus Sulfomarinibacteraceae bacterium]